MEITFAFICGAIGNILFGFKSLFQVIRCYKTKSVHGLSGWMLLADFFGNIACAYYIFSNTGTRLFWQYINYGFAALWLIILFIMMKVYRQSTFKPNIEVNRLSGIVPPKNKDD